MKRKTIITAFVLLFIIIASSCNNADNKQDFEPTTENNSTVEFSTEQITEKQTTETTTTLHKETDPLGAFEITENEMIPWYNKKYDGMGFICLYKNDKLYNLGNYVSKDKAKEYNIGKSDQMQEKFSTYAYIYDETKSNSHEYMTIGDIPWIEIKRSDEIRGYNTTELRLYNAELYGNTICCKIYSSDLHYLYEPYCVEPYSYNKMTQFQVSDKNGNVANDLRKLDYNEEYLVSWYEGTQYRELKMNANCYFYTYEGIDSEFAYEINGELTKNGYCVFDLNNVEPGYYALKGGFDVCFVKIV